MRAELKVAYDRYWSAKNPRDEQAAYHEILLFGGNDGYGAGGWRSWTARQLRRLALWIDQY
jgi:hypothetical protein